jgi:hypothetical protein
MIDKIAVIGAGPSGIIAAGTAASKGKNVVLFEKNNIIGKKLLITGGGRCNITNKCDIQELIDNVTTNKDFLYSAFYTFTNDDIIELLNRYGVETKVESKNRVFPKKDKSIYVVKALEKYLYDNNVKIELNCEVTDVIKNQPEGFTLKLKDGRKLIFNKVIIATGGRSYEKTGSTGTGYLFAKKFGHTIIKLKPSLVPIEIQENWTKDLQGISLDNVNIKAFVNDNKVYEGIGELIFTHFGISGPIALNMSNYINKYIDKEIRLVLDLKPHLDIKEIDEFLISNFNQFPKKQLKNTLYNLFPKRLSAVILKIAEIDDNKYVNQVTKLERKRLTETIKKLEMTFLKFRPINEAMVTSGGVSTNEINPSTMESKLVKGLYFTGEVIDVDALTGGFNLQIAYSTGYLAGLNC